MRYNKYGFGTGEEATSGDFLKEGIYFTKYNLAFLSVSKTKQYLLFKV